MQFLKDTIEARFEIQGIPDGYIFFPSEYGGLELHNPFIELIQLQNEVFEDPENAISNVKIAEKEEYHRAKRNFENGKVDRRKNVVRSFVPVDHDKFMSFEEYTELREEFSGSHNGCINSVFKKLLQQPEKKGVAFNEHLRLEKSDTQYWKWVCMLYKEDMLEHFGELKITDRALLPTSMISFYRSGRAKWQG